MKGAWESPAALELFSHVACDVNRLPVREVISGAHLEVAPVVWTVPRGF
jgi:acetoacetate decarboxylase